MAFNGFSEQTIDFFWGIRLNNERPWYHEHKDECKQYVTGPMNELANMVFDAFSDKRPDLEFTVHMSRIYRDARRLYGKGPYKDYLWFTLHDAAPYWTGRPSFWFEIGADSWSYGLGCWDESTEFMKQVRKRIETDPAGFLDLNNLLNSQSEFSLGGDEYKKQYNTCPVSEIAAWYRKKSIDIYHREAVGPAITGEDFGKRISDGLLSLLPFYDYLCPISRLCIESNEEKEENLE